MGRIGVISARTVLTLAAIAGLLALGTEFSPARASAPEGTLRLTLLEGTVQPKAGGFDVGVHGTLALVTLEDIGEVSVPVPNVRIELTGDNVVVPPPSVRTEPDGSYAATVFIRDNGDSGDRYRDDRQRRHSRRPQQRKS